MGNWRRLKAGVCKRMKKMFCYRCGNEGHTQNDPECIRRYQKKAGSPRRGASPTPPRKAWCYVCGGAHGQFEHAFETEPIIENICCPKCLEEPKELEEIMTPFETECSGWQ